MTFAGMTFAAKRLSREERPRDDSCLERAGCRGLYKQRRPRKHGTGEILRVCLETAKINREKQIPRPSGLVMTAGCLRVRGEQSGKARVRSRTSRGRSWPAGPGAWRC